MELYSLCNWNRKNKQKQTNKKTEPSLKKAFENKTQDISEANVPGIYTSGHRYQWA